MAPDDYYAVLGVLPEAEACVIAAAYRVLAQRYHPDRWPGDAEEAHARMSALNAAFETLRDPIKRAEYDARRKRDETPDFGASEEKGEAFKAALSEIEDRWHVACEVYPDLVDFRARLHRVSASLAFGFVTALLSTRQFAQRENIAAQMEQRFLETYFSSDPQLVDYARRLILNGQREAALRLNRLVDVVGVPDTPGRLEARIDAEFGLAALWARLDQERHHQEQITKVAWRLLLYEESADAKKLAQMVGYTVAEVPGGLFRHNTYSITTPEGATLQVRGAKHFVEWAIETLPPKHSSK